MKTNKKRMIIAGLAVALLMIAATTTWAATSGTNSLGIAKGSSLSSGKLASITNLASNKAIIKGKADKILHAQGAKVSLGSSDWSDEVAISVYLQDPLDGFAHMGSPKSWIEFQVWYPDPVNGENMTIDGETVKVSQDTSERASARVNLETGDVVLIPSISGVDTYYILMNLVNPKGPVLAGTWQTYGDIQLYIQVNKL